MYLWKYNGKFKLMIEYGFIFTFTLMRFYLQPIISEIIDMHKDVHMILRAVSWAFMWMSMYREWKIINYLFKLINESKMGGKTAKSMYEMLKI